MEVIKASKDFTFNGIYYSVNDEVKINDFADLVKLNEKGYIKPLSAKELQIYKRKLENKSKFNLGEEE